jgi:pimeloyl-ACP methyl ester carboxylesterase
MRKIGIALVLAIALAGFFLLRPLTVLGTIRDARLALRGVESATVQAGAHRLHYLAEGKGPALLILPGLLSTAADAAPLMASLAPDRRVFALDLLGQGRSDKPDIDYTIAQHSAAVIAFLEQQGGAPTDILGVSLGGWIALDVAAKRPDLVRRLILASSGGLRFETDLAPESFAPQTPEQLSQLLAIQSAKPPSAIPGFIVDDILRNLKRSERAALRTARSMITWREAYDGRLGTIRVPTLVYWGRLDRVIPLSVGRRLAAGIPNARLAVSDDCGHLAVLECKQGFLHAAQAFLDARPPFP